MEQIKFEQYLKAKDVVIVGVSGGPDSTALLRMLLDFSHSCQIKIIVAHVNHGVRGKDADKDEKFVKNLAHVFGLIFKVKRVRLKDVAGMEEKGRMIRRAFFEKCAKKYKAKWILTAHTKDDQIETIIFNFVRGTGVRGLAGIAEVKGKYLRPLLSVSKEELLAYLKTKRQPYCHDATNKDTKYSRNFIRKKLVPLFEKLNPAFGEAVLRNSAIFKELDDRISHEAKDFLDDYRHPEFISGSSKMLKRVQHDKQVKLFPLAAFHKLPRVVQDAVIQEAYRKISEAPYGLPMKNLVQVRKLFESEVGNKKVQCPGKVEFFLQKGFVYSRRR